MAAPLESGRHGMIAWEPWQINVGGLPAIVALGEPQSKQANKKPPGLPGGLMRKSPKNQALFLL